MFQMERKEEAIGVGMGLISYGNYLLKIKKEELEDGKVESELLNLEAVEFFGGQGQARRVGIGADS